MNTIPGHIKKLSGQLLSSFNYCLPYQRQITQCFMMMTTDEKKYRQLILQEPLKSVEFLVQTVGFEPLPADGERAVFIRDRLGNCFKAPLNAGVGCHEPVLLYTNDCLSNYFELKTSGTHFINGPQYTPQGLMIEFTDDWGNHYKMLEERFYED